GGNAFTPGFGTRERESREDATTADDLFSLGCAMLALLVPSHVNIAIIPDFASRALRHLEADFRLPRQYSAIVTKLLAQAPEPYDLAAIAECLASMLVDSAPSPCSPGIVDPQRHAADLDSLLEFNCHVIDLEHAWRPMPFDPDGVGPMSFDHGLLG